MTVARLLRSLMPAAAAVVVLAVPGPVRAAAPAAAPAAASTADRSAPAAGAAGIDVQGHRGARGLAPENTLAGFRRALQIGVTTLEADLVVTADDVLVVHHDLRLNPDIARNPDGRWIGGEGPPIRQLTLAELQRYDVGRLRPGSSYARQWPHQAAVDGETIPTLQQLFELGEASGRRPRYNLETKITPDSGAAAPDPETFARLLVEAVRAAGLERRTTIQSFDWRTLQVAQRLAPEIPTACLTIESFRMHTVLPGPDGASPWHAGLRLGDHGSSLPRLVQVAGCRIWSMQWRNLTAERAAEARALGLQLLPWTVNEPADMHRMIDLGVDGIITDYPDRLRQVLAERGLALP
ncbi:MAG TPA: glycerophosphodiester phosphodiesterase [Burkholderiaceae bacterium]|nr:glycerophosphodiester phosphodiesterase [Burkholderiaceae bacterium]